MSEETYRDLLPDIIKRVGAVLPEGFDSWGLKSVHPDLTTAYGFKWAAPGGRSRSDDAVVAGNTKACPTRPGDGLCVATTWRGMASGGIPAHTLLLVAYQSDYVLGANLTAGKLRVAGEVAVVAIVDGWRLVREAGAGADLTAAKLNQAYMRWADLRGADLRYADLSGADLTGADLYRANLSRAKLHRADLSDAIMTDAIMTDAIMTDAIGVSLPGGWTLNKCGVAVRSNEMA